MFQSVNPFIAVDTVWDFVYVTVDHFFLVQSRKFSSAPSYLPTIMHERTVRVDYLRQG
ncbi:MAG TPA: hypothetical protein VNA15_08370 [Candidatus Angelobacter sp.]|nr:hypothetical protein [Candidatus Angelobacter sp.]